MAKAKKAETKTKIKKKKWIPLIAPKIFNETPIGDSNVYEAEDVIGKTVTVNLMNLINDVRKQNINVTFKVNEVKDGKGVTSLLKYNMLPASLKRIVRRGKDKIDGSFVVRTADDIFLRIKPIGITTHKTTGAVLNSLRIALKQNVARIIRKKNLAMLVGDLLSNRLHKEIKASVKKIYTVRIVEIKSLKVVENPKNVVQVKEEPKKAEKKPVTEEAKPTEKVEEKPAEKVEVKAEEVKEAAAN